ncbi:unnamed protein product [Citrullus colocynthis]|uniref:Uncharacterized protein n=1 Tax=Citrullus colocynthis TaxID=252529 RepID=A0ABP0XRM9_9ROSI
MDGRRLQIFHRPSSSSFPPKSAEIRRPSSDFATTISPTMKGSCTLLASVLAASTMAFSSSSSSSSTGGRDLALYPPSQQGFVSESGANRGCGSDSSSEKEKFAPRFDGLRFIETLVTAHR